MKQEYKDIKKSIKDSDRLVFWYDNNSNLLLVDKDKNISKNKIKKINYNGFLYRLNLSFHHGDKYGQGGPLAVHTMIFNKDNKELKKIASNKNGVIWFDKKWLEDMNWREKYLDIIIKKLKGSFEFKIGVYLFNML